MYSGPERAEMDFGLPKGGIPRYGQMPTTFVSPQSLGHCSSGLLNLSNGIDDLTLNQSIQRGGYGSHEPMATGIQSDHYAHTNVPPYASNTSMPAEYALTKMMSLQSGENMMKTLPEKSPSHIYSSRKNFPISKSKEDENVRYRGGTYVAPVPSENQTYPSGNQVTTFAHSSKTNPQEEKLPIRIKAGISAYSVPYNLPCRISNELERQLDWGDSWEMLLKVVDGTIFQISMTQAMAWRERGRHESPSNKLLHDFTKKAMTIFQLAVFLDAAKLYGPLELLRHPESLRITRQPESYALIEEGECLSLTCEAVGFPHPIYEWFVYNKTDAKSPRNLLCKQNVLQLTTSMADSGHYKCIVSNSLERLESGWCFVTVLASDKPKLRPEVKKPFRLVIVEETPWQKVMLADGSPLQIKCRAESYPHATYKWYKNCLPLHDQNTPMLRIRGVTYEDSGTYFCVVDNEDKQMRSKHFQVKVTHNGKYEEIYPNENSSLLQSREVYHVSAKVALLIGMGTYKGNCNLPAAANDVMSLESHLSKMGFWTVSLLNLTKETMLQHIAWFCELLDKGVYGLFFFVGHGFEYLGHSFLIPVEALSPYKTWDCINLRKDVLLPILKRDPTLCMAIIDICRVPPDDKNPKVDNDIPENVELPPNGKTLVLHATSAGHQSYEDGTEKKSFFMRHLSQVIDEPISVSQLHAQVSKRLEKDKDVGRQQYSEMLTNLVNPYSLHDPILYHGQTIAINRRRKRWESATRLPQDRRINFPHGFCIFISCYKRVSNEMVVLVNVTNMGEATDYTISFIPKCLTLKHDDKSIRKPNVDIKFHFVGLEKLKESLIPELTVEMTVAGEKKEFKEKLDFRLPLVSNLKIAMEKDLAAHKKRAVEEEKEPIQQEESCHSGAYHKI